MKNKKEENTPKQFNWMKWNNLYFAISGIVLLTGLVSFVKWQFVLGIDFAGGTSIEYKFEKEVSPSQITDKLNEKNIDVVSIERYENNSFGMRLGQIEETQKEVLTQSLKELGGENSSLLSFEQVGPSVSGELIRKTLYAVLLSAGTILAWIAYQFKSIKFGVSATIATFHDALVVLGLFSLFGHLFHAEIDYLFVTALLTILSFSVHDTIVVYDRIREIRRKHGGTVAEVSNRALSETMRRSFFNSLTIIIMLAALVVLGGSTIRWFAVALMVGTISGTYSSPFIAVPLLVTWENVQKRMKSGK